MATGYHQLGTLAQVRGDYEEAERRYRQSLEIDERLGNQAGLATSYGQLGILQTERGANPQAIAYEIESLAIRLSIGSSNAAGNLGRLAKLRARLGSDSFLTVVNGLLDEESTKNLIDLLDRAESPDG